MCGIAGIWQSKAEDTERLQASFTSILKALEHRGPDDSGTWTCGRGRMSLLQTRLSIVDLTAHGHQPMHSHSGRFAMSYNGEIYNHGQVRQELTNQGVLFQGRSDTEVLLEAFAQWGVEETLPKINGMFSIALYDKVLDTLTLVRDRLGEKPLYFSVRDGDIFFSSELKAFHSWHKFNREIDKISIRQYITYGFIPAPRSIYQDVFKLKPGHYITFEGVALAPQKCYWYLPEKVKTAQLKPLSRCEALDNLRSLLLDSVALRMRSDVSMGTFLSGGVDSSLITSLIQSQSETRFDSFTIGFEDHQYDEAPTAKKIAEYIGTNHHEFKISNAELLDIVPTLPDVFCEPFSDESQIPTILVSRIAAKEVKAILSGDGGDEIFGGYNRHIASQTMAKIVKYLPPVMKSCIASILTGQSKQNIVAICKKFGRDINLKQLEKLTHVFRGNNYVDVYRKLMEITPYSRINLDSYQDSYIDAFETQFDSLGFGESVMAYDQMFYLPDNILVKLDRASMATSLETRVPFLDHRLVEFSWSLNIKDKINRGVGKQLLRELLYEYVPEKFFSLNKKGFDVPIATWLREPLKEWAQSLLYDKADNAHVNIDYARNIWLRHVEHGEDHSRELWNILVLLAWLERWESK